MSARKRVAASKARGRSRVNRAGAKSAVKKPGGLQVTVLHQTRVTKPSANEIQKIGQDMIALVLKDSRPQSPRQSGASRLSAGARRALLNACELRVVVVGEAEMKRLNLQFRAKDYVTDILSFDSGEPGVLGELVVCLPVLRRQAREHELRLQEELGYMLLHGTLHLLGYDHESGPREAKRMFALQDRLFARYRRRG